MEAVLVPLPIAERQWLPAMLVVAVQAQVEVLSILIAPLNSNAYQTAGSGGVLGGGGGTGQYQIPGNAGIAGGGGGCGYNNQMGYAYNRALGGLGGNGLVVIQYAVNV